MAIPGQDRGGKIGPLARVGRADPGEGAWGPHPLHPPNTPNHTTYPYGVKNP